MDIKNLDLECVVRDKEKEKHKVKIKSVYEDEFVIVSSNGYLYATGEQSGKKGVFKIIMEGWNRVKIKQEDGAFVRLDDKGFLIADADKREAAEFKYYKLDKKEYALKAPNGYYVRVKDDDKRLVAKSENTGKKTIFKFKAVD